MCPMHRIPSNVSSVVARALTHLVWKATTLVQPSLLKCDRNSAGESTSVNWMEQKLTRRTSQIRIIVVIQPVNRFDLSSNVVVLCLGEKVDDCRVLLIAAKYVFGLFLPAPVSSRVTNKSKRTCPACKHPRRGGSQAACHRADLGGPSGSWAEFPA